MQTKFNNYLSYMRIVYKYYEVLDSKPQTKSWNGSINNYLIKFMS